MTHTNGLGLLHEQDRQRHHGFFCLLRDRVELDYSNPSLGRWPSSVAIGVDCLPLFAISYGDEKNPQDVGHSSPLNHDNDP